MTAREIRTVLKRNKRGGRRPATQTEIARMKGVSKALISMAITNPHRYPDARLYIESVLRPAKKESAA